MDRDKLDFAIVGSIGVAPALYEICKCDLLARLQLQNTIVAMTGTSARGVAKQLEHAHASDDELTSLTADSRLKCLQFEVRSLGDGGLL